MEVLRLVRVRAVIGAVAATIIMVGFALYSLVGGNSEDPLEGVWGPARLLVLETNVEAAGIARNVHRATDGDITFDMTVDAGYERLLGESTTLHVEIVPIHQGLVTIPQEGQHVCVRGTWVIDKGHGEKTEIHPAKEVAPC